MENSFLYSKSISFLTGWTRPDPLHEPAPLALSLSLSLCATARWTPAPSRSHVSTARFSSLSLSLSHSLATTWGPADSPSRLFPNLFPCASSIPAASADSSPRHAKDLRSGRLRPPHPSPLPGPPFEGTRRSPLCHRRSLLLCRCRRCVTDVVAMPEAHRATMSSLQHAVSYHMPHSPPSCRIAACIATTWRGPSPRGSHYQASHHLLLGQPQEDNVASSTSGPRSHYATSSFCFGV
jgi:hypothetical protein